MIPHDGILLTDDGFGWWAVNIETAWMCETCDGYGRYECGCCGDVPCDDCIAGRHTWTAEVECNMCRGGAITQKGERMNGMVELPSVEGPQFAKCPECIGAGTRSVRLSVVPDMVVPIYGEDFLDEDISDGQTHIVYNYGVGDFDLFTWRDEIAFWVGEMGIALPAAAKPGDWAVKVRWES